MIEKTDACASVFFAYLRRMGMQTKDKGDRCEQLVSDHLKGLGHEILARNFHCPYGEIDILSLSPEHVLCVTEVKSLSGRWTSDDVRYMVDNRKMLRLKRTLGHYLAQHIVRYSAIRFDVATVTDQVVTYYIGEE